VLFKNNTWQEGYFLPDLFEGRYLPAFEGEERRGSRVALRIVFIFCVADPMDRTTSLPVSYFVRNLKPPGRK
jgi:hypothetical protein